MGSTNDLLYTEVEALNDKILQDDLDYIAQSDIPFEELKDTTILITGATGLVGVSLVRALLCINRRNKLNIEVIALVRNFEKAKKIYGGLLNRSDLRVLIGDINDAVEVDGKIDCVIHCASITTSKVMINNPVETILTSVEGTKNILNLAKEKESKS